MALFSPRRIRASSEAFYIRESLLDCFAAGRRRGVAWSYFETPGELIALRDPLLAVRADGRVLHLCSPRGCESAHITEYVTLLDALEELLDALRFEDGVQARLFGMFSYDCCRFFDRFTVRQDPANQPLPGLIFYLFREEVRLDKLTGVATRTLYEEDEEPAASALPPSAGAGTRSSFRLRGEETCDTGPEEFLSRVERAQAAVREGEVFQLVLSRAFSREFSGDDFTAFRELHELSPTPYRFYSDFVGFRLFGASPELQIGTAPEEAVIHPIAGTAPRGAEAGDYLRSSMKEQSEHAMLVDLARNDLARCFAEVAVDRYAEESAFSHVTHLVSQVRGRGGLRPKVALEAFAHSFPAGTLVGAPKIRASELIAELEESSRGYYGGAIGYLGLGALRERNELAILIRSVLSRNNRLHYRAGAGIVLDSEPQRELHEIDHKLAAVREALRRADGTGCH